MSVETRRYMRLMVFFDLPTVTKTERRAYTLFRRFLLNDGFDMIQFSVYGRIWFAAFSRKSGKSESNVVVLMCFK